VKTIPAKVNPLYLRCISIFKHLMPDELEKISTNLEVISLLEGETLYRPGQKLNGLYFIVKGVLKQFKIGSKNKEQIYQLLTLGDMLGFDSAMNRIPATEFTACIENARLIFIPIDIVRKLFAENEGVRKLLLELCCRELGKANSSIINFSQKSNKQRVIELLLQLRERFNTDQDDLINVSIKRLEFAGVIGANEENIIRILSDLRKRQIIKTKGRKIGIVEMNKLKEAL